MPVANQVPTSGVFIMAEKTALTAQEREEIRVGLERGESCSGIARGLGRARSTVCREVRRNRGRGRYSAVAAQRRAQRQLARPKVSKLAADPELAAEVERRLRELDSPKRISIELARDGRWSISAETIYHAIYQQRPGLPKGLSQCLHLKRRKRRSRRYRSPNSNSLGIYCSIHDRPQPAADRSEVGHLEGDLIVGARNQSALITLFDRLSRYLWLVPVRAKTADAIDQALIPVLSTIPDPLRRTLAWDHGAEIAHHPKIALKTGIEIYIADPKSPWQRPTNENGNAIVRRYVGKGTNLNQYNKHDLNHIASRINTIPRPILNWATAHDIYTAAVATTT